jgi:hypothetical protein
MLRLMTLLLVISATSGCQHRQAKVYDTACTAFEIIRPSKADTAGTKRQVLQHNTTHRRICKPAK